MKLTKSELKKIIREELNEVGGYGSPAAREESDASFENAMATLKDLLDKGKITLDNIVNVLRGGGEGGPRPSIGDVEL
jgi:hypothetical protein